jgi:hypothetical protein
MDDTSPLLAGTSPKHRSPNFPAVGFPEALERVRTIFDKERQHAHDPKIAARHLGFSWTGTSKGLIAAAKQYGLLEQQGTDVRVTDDAKAILVHPEGSVEGQAIKARMALKPKLFQEVWERFGPDLPSDETLVAKLQMDWDLASEEAARRFLAAFRASVPIAISAGRPVASPPANRPSGGAGSSGTDSTVAKDPDTMRPADTLEADARSRDRAEGAAPGALDQSWTLGLGATARLTSNRPLTARQRDILRRCIEIFVEVELTPAESS